MKATKIKNTILALNKAKRDGADWRQFNAIIRKADLEYLVEDIEAGLHTDKKAVALKESLMANAKSNEFITHRYSKSVRNRATGYIYNRLFVRKVTFI